MDGRHLLPILIASACALQLMGADADAAAAQPAPDAASVAAAAWPVATSLRTTLAGWARRSGWPAPQFLTDADWMVDVSGSIPGSIEEALKVLAAGFGRAAARPRIEITANHVIVVSEAGAE